MAIAALGAGIGLLKEALRARGFGPMAARMPVGCPRRHDGGPDPGAGQGPGARLTDGAAFRLVWLSPARSAGRG